MLTIQDKAEIYYLRDKGFSQSGISKEMNLPLGTVSAFLTRNPVNNIKYICFHCGKTFEPPLGKRTKHFCCSKCRQDHKNEKRRKSSMLKATYVCEECGVVFMASKYKKRRFCSRECFQSFESRRWNKANEGK